MFVHLNLEVICAVKYYNSTIVNFANKLEACLADISTWMSANMLKLNEEKQISLSLTQNIR